MPDRYDTNNVRPAARARLRRYTDWQLEEAVGQGIEAVRPIRDETKAQRLGLTV